jgi:hypothetical protein
VVKIWHGIESFVVDNNTIVFLDVGHAKRTKLKASLVTFKACPMATSVFVANAIVTVDLHLAYNT